MFALLNIEYCSKSKLCTVSVNQPQCTCLFLLLIMNCFYVQVIDFGCAECNLIKLLKGEDYIEEICGVDINGNLLECSKKKIEPLTSDYINPRANPLTIRLIQVRFILVLNSVKILTSFWFAKLLSVQCTYHLLFFAGLCFGPYRMLQTF